MTRRDPRVALDGAKLRALRIRRGLTQTELGQRAGLAQATISSLERAHRTGLADTVAAVAAVLHVDAAQLAPPAAGGPVEAEPGLRYRLDELLDHYDRAPRRSDDAIVAGLVRAALSALDAHRLRAEAADDDAQVVAA